MKERLVGVLAIILSCLPAGVTLRADEPSAKSQAAQPSGLEAEMDALTARINKKIEAGAQTEEALAEELKTFDSIIASHKSAASEELAGIVAGKAVLYLQVLGNIDKAEALFKQIKSDYPNTEVAKKVDAVLADIAVQKEKQRIQATLVAGVAFPDFQEKDVNGNDVSLGKLKGKVVLVDFWATWCMPCVFELPNLISLYGKYHDKGFEIVGISLDQDQDSFKSYLGARGIKWTQIIDVKGWEGPFATKYGISGIPATYLLDRDGKIIAKDVRGEDLAALLEKELGK